MFELSIHISKKYMGTLLLFEDLAFQVYSGERVGLVGANGTGKSTLLKLIAGIEKMNIYIGSWSVGYDDGYISVPKEARVAYLDQIPNYPSHYSVLDVLNQAFTEVHELEQQLRQLEEKMKSSSGLALEQDLKAYGNLTALYEVKGGYETQEKLSKICTGLGFSDDFLSKPFEQLSGGEKTSVILGKILMDRPDILLLDEPTNHLDLSAIEWLETYLRNFEGIVIIVSHDRYFLDKAVNKVVELEDLACKTYKGNYSAFQAQKEKDMLVQFENYKEQQKQIDAMEKAIKDLRDWAARADNNKFFKRAVNLQMRLDRMKKIDRPQFDRPNMKIDLKGAKRSGVETIIASDLSKGFEDKALFDAAEMRVEFGERIALIGPNGSGKSTLIKMLLGEMTPDAGQIRLGASTTVAYLPQNVTFRDETLTILETFRDGIDIPEGKAREYLSKFMYYGKDVFKVVKHLSGGERIRLKLSRLLYDKVNVLILDEPTNHLDIDSIETLEEALEDFNGTLFFISHDRYFINTVAKRILAIEDKKLLSYPGNYDAYRSELQRLEALNTPITVDIPKPKAKPVKQVEKARTEKAPVITPEKLEKQIANLEYEISEIDTALLDTSKDYGVLTELYNKKQHLQLEVEDLLQTWMTLN